MIRKDLQAIHEDPSTIQVVMKSDGALGWSHVLTLLEDAEQTQNCHREKWIDAPGSSIGRMEHCEDQNETIINTYSTQTALPNTNQSWRMDYGQENHV